MVIDSHVHFWKYNKNDYSWIDGSMKVLQKDYLPQEIEPTLRRNNVDGCVAVQAVSNQVETRFLAELSNTHPIIKGVIGWADLRSDTADEALKELQTYPSIKGIRHIVQSEPDEFLYDKSFRAGLSLLRDKEYTFDLLIYPRQISAAVDLVRAFPEITFVVDHCAKPAVKNDDLASWKPGITDLAMFPNVYCKLSGLVTEAEWKEWSPADFYPYLDVVFEAFGANRLLFGSDWPVMLLSGMYVQWKSLLEKYTERELPEDREKIFGGNARRVYRLY